MAKQERALIQAMSEMKIIDAHEHLPPEQERITMKVDIFTLFTQYTHVDLLAAGMNEKEYLKLLRHDIPLDTRWTIFAQYWKNIRWTSFSRAALLAARKLYGARDINSKTYHQISRKMERANRKGIYKKVLRDACNIRMCLTQCGRTDVDRSLFAPIMPLLHNISLEDRENLLHPPFAPEAQVKTLDDYIDACKCYISRIRKEGAVGMKILPSAMGAPDRKSALSLFAQVKSGRNLPKDWTIASNPLRDYILEETVKFAGKQGLVVAVHTGFWGDFRSLHPGYMIPIATRNPDVRFDVYHLGYPYTREAMMLGKNFPNVWLNLCWLYAISRQGAISAIDELLDLVPVHKVMGFGGDYRIAVEKVYGHLAMAKEALARVFAARIKEGYMTEKQALDIINRWLFNNPKELYGLSV